MSPLKVAIFDFDGTLFDTHRSISHCIKLTFDTLLPAGAPSESQIEQMIASGAGLEDTFRRLHPGGAEGGLLPDENRWVQTYRALYASQGQPLITAFAGAGAVLEALRARRVVPAIVSNKGAAAVQTALRHGGLDHAFAADLIVGDATPGAARKPDPASFARVLVPALEKRGVTGIGPADVLVVGDTEADIRFAARIGGAPSVWCRYGYGDREKCKALGPTYTVDALGEVQDIIMELTTTTTTEG